ncbi:MAG: MATE family efflux transporter [Clostridium sp.]|nr:MATE family efflux transporter [Clostridium sp.]
MARDMTQGNITGHMLSYAVPLVFGNLFQQLYHTVDSVVVGQFNGKEALASIGAAGPIMNILIFLIVGISMGSSILMAGYFGAQDYESLRKEMATSLGAGLLLTAVLTVVSAAGSGFFIRLTRTPEEIAPLAADYLRIVSSGLFFTFLYNILSAGLRAVGDSKAPLCVLIFTTVVNVALDLLLVGFFGMGVYGAAIATVAAQAVSALALLSYLFFRARFLWIPLSELKIDRKFLKKTIDFSSVSALQQTMLYLGRLLVQSGINSLGVDAVAAFNAVSIADSYVLAPGDSLAAAMTTFAAQNKGAGTRDRIGKGLKTMLCMAEIYVCMAAVIVFTQSHRILGIFLKPQETSALAFGLSYLLPMSWGYILTGITNTFQGYFRGIGNLKITLWATLLQIPIRVAVTYLLLGTLGVQAAALGTIIGWICMAVFQYFCYRKWGIHETGA